MNIIKENGKRLLKTSVELVDNYIDATKLFQDLQKVVDLDESNGVTIDRKHPAKKLVNRFSGQYFSPTMMKGFNDCPASLVINALKPYTPSAVTEIGTTVHSILEQFYNLDGPERSYENLDIITEKIIKEKGQEGVSKKILAYIEGFKETPDYLYPDKPMDHKNLDCYNELFVKGDFKPLDVELPLTTYCLADRVDIRPEGIYLIDYKTGNYLDRSILGEDGYLYQMIAYKWGIEHEYGEKVSGCYLLIPGTKEKFVEVDVNSLEYQSKFIDKIFDFEKEFKDSAKTRRYEQKLKKYCNYCDLKQDCNVFNNKNENKTIDILYDITIEYEDIMEELFSN